MEKSRGHVACVDVSCIHSAFCILHSAFRVLSAPKLPPSSPTALPTFRRRQYSGSTPTPPARSNCSALRVTGDYLSQRVQTQTELGDCELPAGAKYIRQGMIDADPQVRASAAQAAARIHEPAMTGRSEKAAG